jgi:large subunit ribosomal protein L27
MAHKKAMGSTENTRDSNPSYLGVKAYGGEFVHSGRIIVRHLCNEFHPGHNVGRGSDDTLFAKDHGVVKFSRSGGDRKYVHVVPEEA